MSPDAVSKTSDDSPEAVPPGTLVVPAHGGGLLRRGNPGNSGGGRTPSVVRDKLARIVDQHGVEFVRKVLAGEMEGATIADRLSAFEKAGKFSIGTIKGVDEGDIAQRLQDTIAVISRVLPPELADKVLSAIEPIWRGEKGAG